MVEAEFIAAVRTPEDLAYAREQGVTDEWFASRRMLWNFVSEYVAKVGEVPGLAVLQREDPEYEPPIEPASLQWLVDELRVVTLRRMANGAMLKAAKRIDDEPHEALTDLMAELAVAKAIETASGGQGSEGLEDGAAFLFSEDAALGEPLWGAAEQPLWASGEALWLWGQTGIGKGTLTQRIALAAIGVGNPEVLGEPVRPVGRVLYLALDRARQVKRSLRRMVTPEQTDVLRERLRVWGRPLPFDVGAEPTKLTELVRGLGMEPGDLVIIDAAKDATGDLADNKLGPGFNRACQMLLADGYELLVNNHPRKAVAGNKRPDSIDDMMGHSALKNGAGTVLMLWSARPGEPVDVVMQKGPAGIVSPMQVTLDLERGDVTVHDPADLLVMIERTPGGVTREQAAIYLTGKQNPTTADKKRAIRRAEALVEKGLVEQSTRPNPSGKGDDLTVYLAKKPPRAGRTGEGTKGELAV
ncbi:MAG: AAA family ATPase [Dehalococcoidia bacterium]|nr:AAA family ATPase [Dehalococcoidia bacterium]